MLLLFLQLYSYNYLYQDNVSYKEKEMQFTVVLFCFLTYEVQFFHLNVSRFWHQISDNIVKTTILYFLVLFHMTETQRLLLLQTSCPNCKEECKRKGQKFCFIRKAKSLPRNPLDSHSFIFHFHLIDKHGSFDHAYVKKAWEVGT